MEKEKRKIVQIATSQVYCPRVDKIEDECWALCNDGTLWRYDILSHKTNLMLGETSSTPWVKLHDIPQDED